MKNVTSPVATSPALDRSRRVAFDMADHPLVAIWEVTQACDLACVHCRACAVARRHPMELTTDEGFALLDAISSMGTRVVVLTGGDPAKRPDLVPLVRHGTELGLTMALTPSSTPLVTGGLLADLKRAGLARIAVSVDGVTPEAHDAFRGVPGSFAEAIRIFSDARDLGIERQVNFTLSRRTYGDLDGIVALASEVGAALLSVFVVVPTGRATRTLALGADEIETALVRLEAMARTLPFGVKTTAAPHYRRIAYQAHAKRSAIGIHDDVDAGGLARGPRGINDGLGFLFVSHVGDVMPSGFLPLRAGNVRSEPLQRIYRRSPLFSKLRDADQLGGKCGRCPFKLVCGGSRARAYAEAGDPMSEDPGCSYEPPARKLAGAVTFGVVTG